MGPAIFDELEQALRSEGPSAALERLCARLREERDFDNLFYARLMAKRHELGVWPVPTAPAGDVPPQKQGEFEEAIRLACREVGSLYLGEGKVQQAWAYFRAIGEHGPVEKALEEYRPGGDEDEAVEGVIQVALYEGVLPRRGFDLVLERYGLCSAITTLGQSANLPAEVRQHCVGRVTRTLYEELRERLASDIERREGEPPPEAAAALDTPGVVRAMIAGRDALFEDDCYHVDFSHLLSVVQMSAELSPGDDLERARELCEYGQRLSKTYQTPGDEPFEDQYRDYGVYLSILADEDVEAGLAHFRAKLESYPAEEVGTRPAEVLVQLLLRLDRPAEALEVARKYLAPAEAQRLTFTADLCRQAGDSKALAEVAREQGNAVQFLAGLLAQARDNC